MRARWGRLMDRRATELLADAAGTPMLVVAVAGGYRLPPEVLRSAVVLATPGAAGDAPIAGEGARLPFATGSFASVIDTSRPEEQALRPALDELLRVCRPGGTVATIACGGPAGDPRVGSWAALRARIEGHGPEIARAVPFDVFGMRSPWLPREDDILAELESHLRHRAVRRAVRFLDRHLVAALSPEEVGSVALVLRKTVSARRAESTARVGDLLASRPFARRVLELLRDDEVVRFAAFLDTAVLSPAGVPFHLARWLADVSIDPVLAPDAVAGLLPRRLWWTPRRDVQRVLAAAGHRLAHRTITALADLPGARAGGVSLPATLEYELVALFNRELGRCTEEV